MKLSDEDKQFLELYSDSVYEKPSITIDCVIFRLKDELQNNYRKLPKKTLQVFLHKREYSPYKNRYGVVGTFIDLKSELNHTVKLCLKNKINAENFYFEQLYTFGDKARDPRSRVISISYMILANESENFSNGEWFDVNISQISSTQKNEENGYKLSKTYELTLKNDKTVLKNTIKVTITKEKNTETKQVELLDTTLAFDHAKFIYYAHERLKNKLEYTDIIFNLLKSKFTLTELKNCFEEILGDSLLDANFRRKISKSVQPIDEYIDGKGHRPSQLFVYKNTWSTNNIE